MHGTMNVRKSLIFNQFHPATLRDKFPWLMQLKNLKYLMINVVRYKHESTLLVLKTCINSSQ